MQPTIRGFLASQRRDYPYGATPKLVVTVIVAFLVVVAAMPADARPARVDAGEIAGAHDCVPRVATDRQGARDAWNRLTNPIFALDHMTKDQTIRLVEGTWHLFFSERLGAEPSSARTGHWTSTGLARWRPARDAEEWNSPDLTRPGVQRYVITAQLPDPADPGLAKLYFRTARRPTGPWTEPVRLAPGLFEDQRLIDGALAHTDHGVYLLFKRGSRESIEQFDELAYSPSGSLDGPWEYLGPPDLPWSENYQFLPIDGVWHVLVTRIPAHEPVLYRLVGDPAEPRSWLDWEEVRVLQVPAEAWNSGENPGFTHETANSAYLCDARRLDGHWYLFYAGSDELNSFDGRGHAKIGVARSTDLASWEVP